MVPADFSNCEIAAALLIREQLRRHRQRRYLLSSAPRPTGFPLKFRHKAEAALTSSANRHRLTFKVIQFSATYGVYPLAFFLLLHWCNRDLEIRTFELHSSQP